MDKGILIFAFCIAIVGRALGQSPYYVNHSEIGALVGKTPSDDQRVNFSIQSFNGIRVNPQHQLGLLVGIDSYRDFTMVPLAVGWRGLLAKGKKNSPYERLDLYTSIDLGHSSAVFEKRIIQDQFESWYQGGLFFSPAIGIRKHSKYSPMAYSWSVGYKRQHASHYNGTRQGGLPPSPPDDDLPPGFSSINRDSFIFNSLFFRFGLIF